MEFGVQTPVDSIGSSVLTDPSALRRLGMIKDERARAEAIATQLESVFFNMMIKAMRATVPEGWMLGEGLGGKHYIDMMDQELARMAGGPRDPRFHEALVQQILGPPVEATQALSTIGNDEASSIEDSRGQAERDQPGSESS
jgi:Rod binding domain-containing protein